MPFDFDALLAFISDHPLWAGVAVFLIACGESLAVVGLILPGVAMMFGVGALVGSGHLPLVPVLAWAAAGAIAGDGISFWLGRRYRERLLGVWPFSKYPALVERSAAFFHRHGGKSVLFGRFIGPIRPVIPAVVGMLGMPPSRFLPVNVLSGLLWAPAYTLPGAVFAASLDLAAEVAARLVLAAGILAAVVGVTVWVVRRLFLLLHPRAHGLIVRLLAWSRLHPVAGELPAALLDPAHPEMRGLTLLGLLLVVAALAFTALARAVAGGVLLRNLDDFAYQNLLDLRSPFADRLMVALSLPGEPVVLAALSAAVCAWLLRSRRPQAVAHWLAAGAFALVITQVLHLAGLGERPAPAGSAGQGFPSGLLLGVLMVYGFFAVLLGREVSDRRRWGVYALVAALVSAIAFARVYLGAVWLSDALGGLTLGFAWLALLGIAYRRHAGPPLPARTLALVAGIAFLVAGGFAAATRYHADLARYQPYRPVRTLPAEQWWGEGWGRLPLYRADLRERRDQPLTLQYAGDLAALERQLAPHGWRPPLPLDGISWVRWLSGEKRALELPVLPQVHDGRHEALLLVKPLPDPQRMLVLRLWPADVSLTPGAVPLWVGKVSVLGVRPRWGLAVPLAEDGMDQGLATLREDLAGAPLIERTRICRPVRCPLLTFHELTGFE